MKTKPVIDFSRYVDEKARDFTGREWLFGAINDWLSRKEASRYFLLTGDPGSGKSAIAARLTQFSQGVVPAPAGLSHLMPSFLSSVHFCSARDLRWINPHVFAESLALQLAARYPGFAKTLAEKSGDRQIIMEVEQKVQKVEGGQVVGIIIHKLDVSAISAQDAFIRVVREPLEALLGQGFDERVVILVDSLDESLHYSGTDSIVSLLSQAEHLPVGVNFILTSRSETDVLRPLSRHSLECSLTYGEALSRSHEDVERYVIQTLVEHPTLTKKLAAEMSQEDFKVTIRDKSEGNFLYVKYLFDMLTTEQEKITQRSLDQIPSGLDGIYIEFLERLIANDMTAWANKYGPVLGTLAVARSALTEAQISAFVKRDKPEVRILLQKIRQLLDTDESMPASQRVYTTYHRSFADFLLHEDRSEEYWCDEVLQHQRIARYYLDTFRGSWIDCDSYGLSQLVSHVQFLIKQKQKQGERDEYVKELCDVVTDESFRNAQIDRTGDPLITLTGLRTALDIVTNRDELVAALACIGAIIDTKQSVSLTKTIFDAVAARDFERAAQRARLFWGDEWARVLNLYVVWEAAESGAAYAAESAFQRLRKKNLIRSGSLGDVLMVRTARTLAQKAGGSPDARAILEGWGRKEDAGRLLEKHAAAEKLDQPVIQQTLNNIEQSLSYLEQTIAEGAAEGVSLDSERAGSFAGDLQEQLVRVAADLSGQSAIDRALKSVLGNPYPRYRDIALTAVGTAVVCVPDPSWVRERLQRILFTTIEREGVTFTFDLPSILVSEARRRNLQAPKLAAYLDKALSTEDRWGTSARARSAHAAALFFEGDVGAAFEELEEADQMDIGMAGFSTLTLLSFADRCCEFGQPEKALSAVWGSKKDISLLEGALGVAQRVRDPKFRNERIRLVEDYCQAFKADHVAAYSLVFKSIIVDPAREMALLAHLSARCCWPPDKPNWEALKSLIPLVLDDSTILDAVIARIFRLRIKELNDNEVAEAIRVCTRYLTTGRPWEFGQWH